MKIIVFFVSIFYIGSSVAYTDVQRLESLKHVNMRISTIYLVSLAKVYNTNGYNVFKRTTFYTELENQDGVISAVQLKMTSNALLSDYPDSQEEVPTVEEVINSWKEKAIAAISHLTNKAVPQVHYERDQGTNITGNRIIQATRKVMGLINTDDEIIDEQKRSSCPIYAHLETVISTFAVENELNQFRQDYGTVVVG